jgi:hypothetical protein
MTHVRKISIFATIGLAALLLMLYPAAAADKTLTVGTGSGAVGATISIPIVLNDASGVGGVAFTMTYFPDILEFAGLEQVGKVITDGSAEPYSDDQLKNNMFYQVNDEKVGQTPKGRLMVVAATANALTGTNLALFNAKFKILAGSGAYPINLVRTIINNPQAGYATPTEIPVLVGTTTPDGSGNYTSTDFPVYPAQLFAGSITVNAVKYSLGGKVRYEGGAAASGAQVVLKRLSGAAYVFDSQATVDGSGNYAFTNKINGTYKVFATSNNPGYYDAVSGAVAVAGADATVPDITLPAPQRLTGTITVNGGALAGVQVKVLKDSQVIGVYAVNADGTFQTPPLPPGTYKLKAVYGNQESAEFNPGETMPWTTTLYAISGAISGLTGGEVAVTASSTTGKLQKTVTVTGNAAYVIDNLVPANDYIVSAVTAGFPVTYHNGTTNIADATKVDISTASQTGKDIAFVGGTGTISGTVTDNAAAVPGIGVFAFETTTNALTYVPANASGAYSFVVAPGSYRVFVIKGNGKFFYYADGGTTQDEAGATMISVAPGGTGKNISLTECNNTLSGVVTYKRAGGDPAANVLVSAMSAAGNAASLTGPNGSYTLTGLCAGTYQVEMNPLDAKYAIQRATVVVPTQTTQDFVIDTGNVLTGLVIESGTATAIGQGGAMLYLLDQHGLLVNNRMYFSHGTTGNYTIADIDHGVYSLIASHPLYQSFSEANLEIRLDMVKNISMVKGYSFNVTVQDGDNANAPLAGVTVMATRTGEAVFGTTDKNGNCKLFGLGNYSDYIISAIKQGFNSGSLTGQTPATGAGQAVTITLNRPAATFTLSGTITSSCAGAIDGAYVLVSSAATNFFASTKTNASGSYSLTVPAAAYQFVVVPGGNLQVYVESVTVAGNTPKDVAIPCGSDITGTVTRTGTAPIYVFLYTAAGVYVDTRTADGSGAYTFTGLVDTTNYKVLAVSTGNAPKWYNGQTTIGDATAVPAGQTGVNIQLTP